MTNHLVHYSSPYYDPIKAHEYYMKTRKLKGTSSKISTAGLNDEGKAAAKYVKNQLTTERKTKVTANNEASKSEIEKLRAQKKSNIEAHKSMMENRINTLREKVKRMSAFDKTRNRDRVSAIISNLRAQNQAVREQLNAEFKSQSEGIRTERKTTNENLKTEYDDKYASELERIKATPGFQRVYKSKRKSST